MSIQITDTFQQNTTKIEKLLNILYFFHNKNHMNIILNGNPLI